MCDGNYNDTKRAHCSTPLKSSEEFAIPSSAFVRAHIDDQYPSVKARSDVEDHSTEMQSEPANFLDELKKTTVTIFSRSNTETPVFVSVDEFLQHIK